jgi:hypothetical protein
MRPRRSSWWRHRSPAEWYAIVVGAFLAVRGISTLVAGASFAQPGDGWRAVYQLGIAAVLLLSLRRRATVATVVLAVGAVYALVTVLGFVNGHDILGLAPVDARDKVVHPLLAIAALVIGVWEFRVTGTRRPGPAPSA